jgi:UDPglucose 6-dehydrogenase
LRVTVIGSGYVGLVAGACLAEAGNDVVCVDSDAAKIERLERADLPIYEPGLQPLVERNLAEGRLRFTVDAGPAIERAPVVFIAVGTPAGEDGTADLSHVLEVAEVIGRHMVDSKVVVTKSTVPVGTTARVRERIAAVTTRPFHVCANPEFLKEGGAVEDFMKPDRVIIGTDSATARATMAELYAPFTRRGGDRLIFMDAASAEVTKYAANAMLATRISFMNQMARLCEAVDADVVQVRRGIGADRRIGRDFLYPGPGYGGSCFRKDVRATIRTAEAAGVTLDLLRSVDAVNEAQKGLLLEKVRRRLGSLAGRRIGIWGLAFKAETDEMRESPAIVLIEGLLAEGAGVTAHDPKAMEAARRRFGQRISYAPDPYAAALDADALIVVTEWLVYRTPDFERLRDGMRRALILDGRNLYAPDRVRELGFEYEGIGRGRPA